MPLDQSCVIKFREEFANEGIVESAVLEMESAGNFFKRVAAVELLPEEMLFGVQQQITVLAEIVQHEVARAVER